MYPSMVDGPAGAAREDADGGGTGVPESADRDASGAHPVARTARTIGRSRPTRWTAGRDECLPTQAKLVTSSEKATEFAFGNSYVAVATHRTDPFQRGV